MLFIIEAIDKKDSLKIRLNTRPKHLEYLKTLGNDVVLAGPFLDGNEKPNGSLIIVKSSSLEVAKEMAKNDPYNEAGLFESVKVRAWLWAVNKPENIE